MSTKLVKKQTKIYQYFIILRKFLTNSSDDVFIQKSPKKLTRNNRFNMKNSLKHKKIEKER